jgi:tetratricopeptide (TPR) repeat protein
MKAISNELHSERLKELKKFLEQEPNDSFTHYAIALEYASLKKIPEAIQKLEELILLDPNYIPAYQQLGYLFAQSGRQEAALLIFEKGIEAAALVGDTHAQKEMEEAMDELED